MKNNRPTITLNGVKFAPSKSALVDSLFNSGGTAAGWYDVTRGGSIRLFDAQGNRIGGINRNGVLHDSKRLEDGRYWHTYANPSIIGEYASYSQKCNETQAALEAVQS